MIQIVEFFHHIEYLEWEVPEFTAQIVRCTIQFSLKNQDIEWLLGDC